MLVVQPARAVQPQAPAPSTHPRRVTPPSPTSSALPPDPPRTPLPQFNPRPTRSNRRCPCFSFRHSLGNLLLPSLSLLRIRIRTRPRLPARRRIPRRSRTPLHHHQLGRHKHPTLHRSRPPHALSHLDIRQRNALPTLCRGRCRACTCTLRAAEPSAPRAAPALPERRPLIEPNRLRHMVRPFHRHLRVIQ